MAEDTGDTEERPGVKTDRQSNIHQI